MAAVTFPDALIWAFNPNYITIAGATDVSSATVTIKHNVTDGESCTLSVALYNGEAKVYISRIVQILFSDPETTRAIPLAITVNVAGTPYTPSNTITAVWGTIEMGDRFSSYGAFVVKNRIAMHVRHIQCFVNYPYVLDLLCPSGSKVRSKKDGDVYYADGSDTAYYNDDPQSTNSTNYAVMNSFVLGTDMEIGTNTLLIRQDANGSDVNIGTFDETFDKTFYNPVKLDIPVETVLHKRTEKEGIYLRWIDRFGFREYYLFDIGTKSLKTSLSDVNLSTDKGWATGSTSGDSSNIYFAGHKRNKGVTTERTIKVCAVNLDEETLDYVADIVNSPYVDMYIGTSNQSEELWMPIQVKGGTYSYDIHHKPLQDFEITLKLPNKIAQTL